jgi:hypothetical protein
MFETDEENKSACAAVKIQVWFVVFSLFLSFFFYFLFSALVSLHSSKAVSSTSSGCAA